MKAGNIKNLTIIEEELDPPRSGEVQIAVKAIGLNFADIFAIWGLYSATPKGAFTPGLEYAGIVAAVGDDVWGFEIGDRIMGITRFGGYASQLNIDHRYVVPLPVEWSFEGGASYLVQVLTAYYALFNLGGLQPESTVLIHSGAGGVGIYANRLAKAVGAYTIGTTGSSDKIAFMLSEGYDQALVRSKNFKSDLIQALTGRPLTLVMECIGGRILKDAFDLMAPEGRMVVYGSANFASPGNRPNYLGLAWRYLIRPKIDPLALPNTNRSLLGFNLIWLYEQVEKMHDILKGIQQYEIGRPHVGHQFGFEDLPEAVRLLLSGKTKGKVVVKVEECV